MRPPLPLNTLGEINTRKKPSGKWVARAYYRDDTGKRRDMTATGKTKAAAANALKEKAATYRPIEQATADMILAAFTERWYEEYKTGVSENTARISENIIRNYINPVGQIRLREITVSWVEKQLTNALEIVESGNMRRGGKSTAMRLRTMLKMILAEAVRLDALPTNPAEHSKPIQREKTAPKSLTTDQLGRLRANIHHFYETHPARHKAATYVPNLIDFLAGTGCRVGEAISLRWEDINFQAGMATIRSTAITNNGASKYQPYTKTKNNRAVMLPGWLIEILATRPRTSEYVFPSSTGGMVKYGNLKENFAQARGTEFAGCTPKILRATVATLIERELGAEAAALQLGHDDVQTTKHSYIERRGVSDARGVLGSL